MKKRRDELQDTRDKLQQELVDLIERHASKKEIDKKKEELKHVGDPDYKKEVLDSDDSCEDIDDVEELDNSGIEDSDDDLEVDITDDGFEFSPEEEYQRQLVTDQVQEDVNLLVKELKKHSSPKILDSLLASLETLLEHSAIVGLDIHVDDLYNVLGYGKYNRIVRDYEKGVYNQCKKMYKTNKILTYNVDKMFEENGYIPFSFRYRNRIDPMTLAGEFFKYYDKDLYEFFNLELNRKHYFDWLLEPTTGGCTIDIPVKDKSYILLNSLFEDNVMKASIVAHETIHAYFNHLQKYRDYDAVLKSQINNLNEVYSTFIQLVFVDWLKKINYKSRDLHALDNYNKFLLKDFNEALSSKLYQFEDFLDRETLDDYYHNEGEIENLENAFAMSEVLKALGIDESPEELVKNPDKCKIEMEYPKDFDKYTAAHEILTPEAYFYGYLLGFNFLDDYLRDPMKTKENITRFTLDSTNRDKLDLLDGYGLGLDRIKDTNSIKKLIYTKDYYK